MVRIVSGIFNKLIQNSQQDSISHKDLEFCRFCDQDLTKSNLYTNYRVCPSCKFHYSQSTKDRIKSLTDSGSFREHNNSLFSSNPISFSSKKSYRKNLFSEQKRTGLTEAVVTGSCRIGGIQCLLIILDFGFMGGSMGSVVGEKIASTFERAAKKKIPLVAIVTSRGTRIQEGVISLMQMAKTASSYNKLKDKGVPFISVLSNPCTGQAYGSFANLADLTIAEPSAIIGYNSLGTVQDSRHDNGNSSEEHLSSESRLKQGLIDAVVERNKLREVLSVTLDILSKGFKIESTSILQGSKQDIESYGAWHSVQLARHSSRPTSLDFMARILDSFVEIHGDRLFADDPSVVCGLGQIGGQTIAIIGQDRGGHSPDSVDRRDGRTMPEGFRKAQRVLQMAQKFEIPVITLLDTPGPSTSIESEIRGLGQSIASTLSMLTEISCPTISVVIGEGGSAGALALGATDITMMLENSIYSALSPEEAAQLIYQDGNRVDDAAESLKLTATDCMNLGIIDGVIPEPDSGAHNNHHEAARLLKRSLLAILSELQNQSQRKRMRTRYNKYRNMGNYSSRLSTTISRRSQLIEEAIKGYREDPQDK